MPQSLQDFVSGPIGSLVFNAVIAIVILIVGYIVARIVASLVRRLLKRVSFDNRLASMLGRPEDEPLDIEDITAKIVFWALMLFVIVAFFDRLGLETISQPLAVFLERLTSEYLPNLGTAALLAAVAWIVAAALSFLIRRGASLVKLDERLDEYAALDDEEKEKRPSIGDALATAVFWFVLLLFLPSILEALGISEVAEPISEVFDQIFAYVPNVLAAGLVLLIGWFVARVVRQITVGLLSAINADALGERIGLTGEQRISQLVGMLLYVFIMLVTLIAALEALDIAAISDPTTAMLETIIGAIPPILGAAVVLVVTYYIARLVSRLATDFLSGIGFDGVPERIGLRWSAEQPPSQWAGYLLLIAIMLAAIASAAELLQSDFLVTLVAEFLTFFWQAVLAIVVIAVGMYFAGLARRIITSSGTGQAALLGRIAQVAIIIFAAAMALGQLGVASSIVNLAFGITLAAVGFGLALAFGLGGQAAAARELDRLSRAVRDEDAESGA